MHQKKKNKVSHIQKLNILAYWLWEMDNSLLDKPNLN